MAEDKKITWDSKMFWKRFYSLCLENNTKPNQIGEELEFSSGVITKWKNGTIPSAEKVVRIACRFGCTTDYLLGISDIKKEPFLVNGSEALVAVINILATLPPEKVEILHSVAQSLIELRPQEDS